MYVANPGLAPPSENYIYAHPDDPAGNGLSWRDVLVAYNNAYKHTGANGLNLLPPYRLHRHQVYKQLVDRYGVGKVSILSAGWGLLSADFLTPKYDITFSARADKYKRRSKRDRYNDFRMLLDDDDEEVVLFGGKAYLPLFLNLTQGYRGKRFVFYRSVSPHWAPGAVQVKTRVPPNLETRRVVGSPGPATTAQYRPPVFK